MSHGDTCSCRGICWRRDTRAQDATRAAAEDSLGFVEPLGRRRGISAPRRGYSSYLQPKPWIIQPSLLNPSPHLTISVT